MELFQLVLIVIAGITIYFLPALIGWKKKHSQGIILLNLFLGWTFLGWIGALIWAVTSEKVEQSGFIHAKNVDIRMN